MRTIDISGATKYLDQITLFNTCFLFTGASVIDHARGHTLFAVCVVSALLAPPAWLSWRAADPIKAVFSGPAFWIYVYVAVIATLGSIAVIQGHGSKVGLIALPAKWDLIVAKWGLIAFLQLDPGGFVQAYLVYIAVPVAIFAAIALCRVRRCDIAPLGVPLSELMRLAGEDLPEKAIPKCARTHPTRGWLFAAAALIVLVIGAALPPVSALTAFSVCYLVLRARADFQPEAESLLSVDQRPPILFLRSFSDDQKISWISAVVPSALFDFSLEGRLTGHFAASGPFVAVGSSDHDTPPAGAARAYFTDDKWQRPVEQWMQLARLIILVAGTTRSVSWEVKQAVNLGHASKLIVLFPEAASNAAGRLDKVIAAFRGTLWERDLQRLDDPTRIRSLTFGPNGEVTAVCGQSANRNECHLAVLISEQLLKQPQRLKDGAPNSHTDGPVPVPALAAPELLERRA